MYFPRKKMASNKKCRLQISDINIRFDARGFNIIIQRMHCSIEDQHLNSAAFYVPSLSSFDNLSLFGDHSIP